MPHDIDGAGPAAPLKSALRRQSKYDEELSIEELQFEEADLSDLTGSDTGEVGENGRGGGGFVDWDDENDPDFIEVNTSNTYVDEDGGDGEDNGKGIYFVSVVRYFIFTIHLLRFKKEESTQYNKVDIKTKQEIPKGGKGS